MNARDVGAIGSVPPNELVGRVAAIEWPEVEADLDTQGAAVIKGLLTRVEASSAGRQSATLTLTSGGSFSGSGAGCSFSGTGTPHGSVNVFDVVVQFHGWQCIFGTSTLYGVAYYDVADRVMYGAAPNASRTDGFLFIGRNSRRLSTASEICPSDPSRRATGQLSS